MLISFVTINCNNESGLIKTFSGYRELKAKNYFLWSFEIIVVDACSTDGSLDILNDNADLIDILIVEPDRGLYDGMNKGISRASGDFVVFMNSGDSPIPDGFNSLVLNAHDKTLAYAGDALRENSMKAKDIIPLIFWFPIHQSILFPSKFLKSRGFRWEQYGISADLEHIVFLWYSGKVKHYRIPVVVFEKPNASAQYKSMKDVFRRCHCRFLIGWKNNAVVPGIISSIVVFVKHAFQVFLTSHRSS